MLVCLHPRGHGRTAGSLSGDLSCGWPWKLSRVDVVSNIIPIEGATDLSRLISAHDMTSWLMVGSRPVLSSTTIAIVLRYPEDRSYAAFASQSRASGQRS